MYIQTIDESNKHLLNEAKEYDNEGIACLADDPFTFNMMAIYDDNDELLGMAAQRVIEEGLMVLNPKASNYKKAKAIKAIFGSLQENRQCNDLIVLLTKDQDRTRKILIKHFDFSDRRGIILEI